MANKPKLMWVSHMVPYPPKAGLLIRSYNLIRELSAYYEITLVALNQRSLITPYFESFEAGTEQCQAHLSTFCHEVYIHNEIVENDRISKAKNLVGSLFGQFPYSVRWLWKGGFLSNISKRLAKLDFQFVYWDSVGLAEYASQLGDVGVPQVMGHHNIESEMMYRRSNTDSSKIMKLVYQLEAKKLQRLERWCDHHMAGNIVCSTDDGEILKRIIGHDNVCVVNNGFDFSLQEGFVRKPDSHKILFIGTMDWYPNIDAVRQILLNIWPSLIAQDPKFELDIIGANPPPDIVDMAINLKGVRVHGFVDSLEPYIRDAGLYLCPIREGGGTKLKLIEAFAFRIPVVSNKIGCEGLNVEDGRHVVYANSADEYVQAIVSLSQNDSQQKILSENAFAHAKSIFSFKSVAAEFNQYLKSISE